MKCITRERWNFLSASLRNKRLSSAPSAITQLQSFDLVLFQKDTNTKLNDSWWRCRLKGLDSDIIISLPEQEVSVDILAGFNNTGHVRVWPSEQVLAYYCTINKQFFNSKRVCEVGGGQTCFAGLAVAHSSTASHILLTDGSQTCVQNVQRIIERNTFKCDSVSCSTLRWDLPATYNHLQHSFDCVLMADCLFFEEGHKDIVDMLLTILKPHGMAIIMAPLRNYSVKRFTEVAMDRMWVGVFEKYEEGVWSRSLQLSQSLDAYDKNLHYPFLITLSPKITPLTYQ